MGGILSVQVLNEFASVAHRKIRTPWAEVREALAAIRSCARRQSPSRLKPTKPHCGSPSNTATASMMRSLLLPPWRLVA